MTQKSSCRSRFLRVPMAMQYRRPKHFPGHMFHDYYHRLLGLGALFGAGAVLVGAEDTSAFVARGVVLSSVVVPMYLLSFLARRSIAARTILAENNANRTT